MGYVAGMMEVWERDADGAAVPRLSKTQEAGQITEGTEPNNATTTPCIANKSSSPDSPAAEPPGAPLCCRSPLTAAALSTAAPPGRVLGVRWRERGAGPSDSETLFSTTPTLTAVSYFRQFPLVRVTTSSPPLLLMSSRIRTFQLSK